jgi:hypothetical protein
VSEIRDPESDQKLPGPGKTEIHDYVINRLESDWGMTGQVRSAVANGLRDRRELGISKYGRALQSHNGRDSLLDAWQEALDTLVYLQQMQLEGETVDTALTAQMSVVEVLAARRIERGY